MLKFDRSADNFFCVDCLFLNYQIYTYTPFVGKFLKGVWGKFFLKFPHEKKCDYTTK